MKLVKDCLPLLFNDVASWKIRLLSLWPQIIGQISDKVILDSIQGRSVILAVKSSAWLHELNCLKMIIIEKINCALAGNYIDRVRFINKECANTKSKARPLQRKKNDFYHQFSLSLSQEMALNNIVDQELKRFLKRFLFRCMSENLDTK